jgi:SAM-dependent methyltransferase
VPSEGYVRSYFDRRAEDWLGGAYVEDRLPDRFPIGDERVRLALAGVAAAFGAEPRLIDLGCGGGHLCAHAARLGVEAVGVDVARGMVDAAEELATQLEPAQAARVRFVLGSFDQSGLPDGWADAVTAMGLIEYLPEDRPLLIEARRLLRPGGRFAVSCRNRLFNLQSANALTASEAAAGEAERLLAELAGAISSIERGDVVGLARELASASDALAAAADADDGARPQARDFEHKRSFAEVRRQHTPAELDAVAADAGLRVVDVLSLHPHPLPPALEPLAPRVFNQLALSWQRAVETSPLGLAFCSAFVAVLERD